VVVVVRWILVAEVVAVVWMGGMGTGGLSERLIGVEVVVVVVHTKLWMRPAVVVFQMSMMMTILMPMLIPHTLPLTVVVVAGTLTLPLTTVVVVAGSSIVSLHLRRCVPISTRMQTLMWTGLRTLMLTVNLAGLVQMLYQLPQSPPPPSL
jgi:hypothetical protein